MCFSGFHHKLVDNLLLAIGFVGQRTDEPKSEMRQTRFEPIQGYDELRETLAI
jgi:hypothetical protein